MTPTLTENEIALLETSLAKMLPISGLAGELFYMRLFVREPLLQTLFGHDIREQGAKLIEMLGLIVGGLRDMETILPVARDLAARHVTYGVKPAMYEPVGHALIDTLSQGLGEAFTDDVRAAWETAYAILSDDMVLSAYPGAPLNSEIAAE